MKNILWSTDLIEVGMSVEEIKEHVRLLGDILKENLGNDFILIRVWEKKYGATTLKYINYQDSSLELGKSFLPTLDCNFIFYFDGGVYRAIYKPFDEYESPEDWVLMGAPNIKEKLLEVEEEIVTDSLTFLDVQRILSEKITKKILSWNTETVSVNGDCKWVKLTSGKIAFNGEILMLVNQEGKVLQLSYNVDSLRYYYNSTILPFS